MIETLLIANRGEIALRVMRTARRMGIRTVAITSEQDVGSPHTRAADMVVRVASYLDVEAVVAAALGSGADAVHPGYGFLSERASFARALETAGVVLVGPSADVMERMGRKDSARAVAIEAGVPVVPRGEDAGFPVLVKAAAGGGGKGMRVVRGAGELDEARAAAAREARSAFGDDTLLVEKYVERGRHIEVQVIADAHGNALHLFERDCSTQRRHQKVLEESPAPTISQSTRQLVTASSIALVEHVGYRNAGTVEFLLDDATGEVYFLEMNTRLQVEHAVTEAVTGLDLVELQLMIAAGEQLPVTQDDITLSGHAIEARVYAEDSFGGFLPQAGRATVVQWPQAGPSGVSGTATIRVDHALESGQLVSTSYDPMLGKVIAHGRTREEARLALVDALDRTAVLGLTTNTGFLRTLVAGDEFRDATIDTAWLDRHEVAAPDPTDARQLAAWAVHRAHRSAAGPFRSDGFRLGSPPADVVVQLDEPVVLGPDEPAERPVAVVRPGHVELAHRGHRFVFPRPDIFGDHAAAVGDGMLVAPMPGTVIDVRVTIGDRVMQGQLLVVVEAMKMEVPLSAPFDGTIASVQVSAGSQVALGARLLEVATDEPRA